MASGPEQAPPGLRYKDANRELTASENTITAVSGSIERMASKALDWSENNPLQFVALLVCVIIIALIRTRGRVDITRMTQEFENRKTDARLNQQQSLPLDNDKSEPGKHV